MKYGQKKLTSARSNAVLRQPSHLQGLSKILHSLYHFLLQDEEE